MTRDRVRYVDSHAHLDEKQFSNDVAEVIERANESGVERIVNIGYEPERWQTTISLSKRFPAVSFTLGLHPTSSDQFTVDLIDNLAELAERTGAVAIGEIGIDLFRDGPGLELQRTSFEAQLSIAHNLGLPVVIHQRAAANEVLAVLSNSPPSLPCVLHSFEGSRELFRLGLDRGYFFGVGGLMTRSTSVALRSLIKEIPLDRLLLETDSPYLTPAGVKERRNEPANIPVIAEKLARLFGIPLSDVADTTSRNAIDIFRLDSEIPVQATMS